MIVEQMAAREQAQDLGLFLRRESVIPNGYGPENKEECEQSLPQWGPIKNTIPDRQIHSHDIDDELKFED